MRSTHDQTPTWHTLYFHIDEDGDSVLTAWVQGSRYHVIANKGQFGADTTVARDYRRLANRVKGVGNGDAAGQEDASSGDDDSDSGVDMRAGSRTASDGESPTTTPLSAEDALKGWMMTPVIATLEEKRDMNSQTVQEWYRGAVCIYQLAASDNGTAVEAMESESTPDLDQWMDRILPNVTLPKYLTDKMKAPSFRASQLEVLKCSDEPVGTPYHPCRVRDRKTKATYFLKVVDNNQPQPARREMDTLQQIESANLHEQIKVPLLEGVVSFDETEPTKSGQQRMMGMLLTEISDPTPLTLKLDSEVPQEKREAWAKEVDRIKDVLHEHEIIWGDAKADNFMVDGQDNLWIIDFGGSYTEGWVDAGLNETEEGDDMGTEKIVNALEDPVANVQQTYEDESGHDDGESWGRGKRKCVVGEEDDGDGRESSRKYARVESHG